MFGRCHDIAANERIDLDWHGEAAQTSLAYLSPMTATAVISNIIPVTAKLRRSQGFMSSTTDLISRALTSAPSRSRNAAIPLARNGARFWATGRSANRNGPGMRAARRRPGLARSERRHLVRH